MTFSEVFNTIKKNVLFFDNLITKIVLIIFQIIRSIFYEGLF